MRIGIMQGRLTAPESGRLQAFPRARWREEFALAAAVGLESVEWIYDAYGAGVNPIRTDEGIEAMKGLARESGVAVVSLCADFFMDGPALDAAKLVWLLERSRRAGVARIVLPFVELAQIESEQRASDVAAMLREVLPEAQGVEIHLETSLDPAAFAKLLDAVPHPLLKVTYDTGNSASLGYSVNEEFAAYGERIGSVHIKDRLRHGGTVPLGKGSADFPAFFSLLKSVQYAGDFILQTAREEDGGEVELARRNLAWLRARL